MKTYRTMVAWLTEGRPTALASVVSNNGAGPRKAGARLAVTRTGETAGSVGGGLLEAAVVRTARQCLADDASALLDYDLDGSDAAKNGMVCGGCARLFVESVRPHPNESALFENATNSLCNGNGNGCAAPFLVSAYRAMGQSRSRLGRLHLATEQVGGKLSQVRVYSRLGGVLARDATEAAGLLAQPLGDAKLHLDPLAAAMEESAAAQEPRLAAIGDDGDVLLCITPLVRRKHVYIFGAGHVGREVAALAGRCDFEPHLVDDRSEFLTDSWLAEAPGAERAVTHLIGNWNGALSCLMPPEHSYMVIVTRGYRNDEAALDWSLRADAAYIGMIGSARKRELVYDALAQRGIPDDVLADVSSPIGLPINADTPQEIAVAIVAELIARRAQATA